jgi:hypothetical protein
VKNRTYRHVPPLRSQRQLLLLSMNAIAPRLLLLIACAISGIVALTPVASAQQPLQVELFENPFVCDAIVRPLGIVSGFSPGETVEFSAPELDGVFSRRVADSSGRIEMRWNCGGPQTWAVTVRGLGSGTSTMFALAGSAAPAPPDAPAGAAFDARSAMTADQMAIWKDFSPFSTVGVYIDVNSSWDNRADKIQSNLTAPWVSQIYADGWSIIPIYVGFQAPDQCAAARFEGLSADPAAARTQGLASAADAVDSVSRLGIGPGNPIYYDMEAYRPGCAEAVLSFLDAWTEGVQSAGYVSGVYGSRSSTMWDLSRALGRPDFDAPDAIWVSTGNGRPDNYGLEIPSDDQWTNARIHQYRLNVTRTYGGVTREIDENTVNAPLARPGQVATPGTSPSPSPSTSDADGDGVTDPEPDNCDAVANPDQSDLDNDGDGDACDRDIDGDGVDNVSDIAPTDATITTAPAATPEAAPEPTVVPTPEVSDVDGDGIADPEPDNCDLIANPDQSDEDNDGDGDVCDIDIDGDGVPNEADQEPRDPLIGALPTPTPSPVEAGPTPTPEPNAEPTNDQIAEPDPTPTFEVAPAPQIVLLPTPVPTPTVTPLPTAVAAAVPNESATPTAQADTAPDQGGELDTETVTITLEDESSLLPGVIAGLSMFSFFCVGMCVRSFRRSRGPITL